MDIVDEFSCRQARFRIVVKLLAGDDVHFPARFGEVECESAQNLASGRMIRKKETIEKDDPRH